jgi:hypothetical protein
MCRGAARVEPPSRPSPCVPRAHARRAGHPTASPPYAAAPPLVGNWPPCVAAHSTVPRPCHACTASPLALVCKEALDRLELGYKAGRPSPRASTEPPPSAIGALTVNSTTACLSSQTRAAPYSTRTPVAPALASWPARTAGSPELVSLLPPPGSHRRALLPARSPSQPTVSAHPLGPSEATRATR